MATAITTAAAAHPRPARDQLAMLIAYKAWANTIMLDAIASVPLEEALKPRATTFGNILMTANHVLVVEDIFRHHLEGRVHPYAFRNTDDAPDLADLRRDMEDMDRWYVEQVSTWSPGERAETIEFEFVGGGAGCMSREEIVLHLVNHATYHRGFVGDMLKQVPYYWPANDLTVFLRDVWHSGSDR